MQLSNALLNSVEPLACPVSGLKELLMPLALLLSQSPYLVQQTLTRRALLPLNQNGLWRIESGVVRTLTTLDYLGVMGTRGCSR